MCSSIRNAFQGRGSFHFSFIHLGNGNIFARNLIKDQVGSLWPGGRKIEKPSMRSGKSWNWNCKEENEKSWNGSTWWRCLWNMNENYGFLKVVIVWVSVQETKDLTKRLVWWKRCVENKKVLKITKSLTKKGKRGQLSLFC